MAGWQVEREIRKRRKIKGMAVPAAGKRGGAAGAAPSRHAAPGETGKMRLEESPHGGVRTGRFVFPSRGWSGRWEQGEGFGGSSN